MRALGRSSVPNTQDPSASMLVDLGDGSVAVAVRVNPRAKRLILRFDVKADQFIVVIPGERFRRDVLAFVKRHQAWMRQHLGQVRSLRVPICDGAIIPVGGIAHRVVNDVSARRGVWSVPAGTGNIYTDDILFVSGAPEYTSRRVKDWLKREARRELTAACRDFAQALDLPAPRISIRDTYSRWGSCSHRDTLSFTWRLAMAPPFVLHYVAAHESAHRHHMNHSPAFWSLTRSLYDDVDRAEAWLKSDGQKLFLYD